MTPEKFVADFRGQIDFAFDQFRSDVGLIFERIKAAVTFFFLSGPGRAFDLFTFWEDVLGAFFEPINNLATNLTLAPARAILAAVVSASEAELGVGQSANYVMTVRSAKAQAVREMADAALVTLKRINFPQTSNLATVAFAAQRTQGVFSLLRSRLEHFVGKKISDSVKLLIGLLLTNLFRIAFSISAVTMIYAVWSSKKEWPSLSHSNPREYGTKKGRFHVPKQRK